MSLNTADNAVAVDEQMVTPWDVKGAVVDGVAKAIDYDKLIKQFGVCPITDDLIERFEKVTGKKAHHLIRRGIFFAHRYLKQPLSFS